jgi:hypothetical protein
LHGVLDSSRQDKPCNQLLKVIAGCCTSYESSEYDRFEAFSVFPPPVFDYKREIYKDYAAPIFRRGADGFSTDRATFGMVPRKRIPPGVKVFDTMNARAESVGGRRNVASVARGKSCSSV